MSLSAVQTLQALIGNPLSLENVRSLVTPDVTYVSLSENNPQLQAYLPWTGSHRGPEAIVKAFEGITKTWQTKAFEVRDVIEQGDKVALFGSFTYVSRALGKEITSLFSLFARMKDGKVSYVQFLEDTFGTSGSVRPERN
jgi:ketosteroid isomerase-like protein